METSCCNFITTRTYWIAETREQAENEIQEETADNKEPHGLCGNCIADTILIGHYRITDTRQKPRIKIPVKYQDENGQIDTRQLTDDIDLYLTDLQEDNADHHQTLKGIVNELRKRIQYNTP